MSFLSITQVERIITTWATELDLSSPDAEDLKAALSAPRLQPIIQVEQQHRILQARSQDTSVDDQEPVAPQQLFARLGEPGLLMKDNLQSATSVASIKPGKKDLFW